MKKVLSKIAAVVLLAMVSVFSMSAKNYIVAVGVADYPGDNHDLQKSVADAEAFAKVYEDKTDASVVLLTDSKATAKEIKKDLKKAFGKATEDDNIIFFYSGHGFPGGFVPSEGVLYYNDIVDVMADSKAKNKMVFADALYAGGISKAQNANKSNMLYFVASRDGETALEFANLENAVFTYYLVKGLNGAADADNDNIITPRELFTYVSNGVKETSKDRQHPAMLGTFSDSMSVIE